MASYNHQPLFTSAPICHSKIFLPDRVTEVYDVPNWISNSTVYSIVADEGELIERVTITTCGDAVTNTSVSKQLAYVFLYNAIPDKYSLYKTFVIPSTTISATTPNPSYELVFTGGIFLQKSDAIVVASSIDATGLYADYYSVIVEGSSYVNIY